MSEISRSALFGKLNPLAYKAIEGATVFCKLRGNPYVELVHWLQQILQTPVEPRPDHAEAPGGLTEIESRGFADLAHQIRRQRLRERFHE